MMDKFPELRRNQASRFTARLYLGRIKSGDASELENWVAQDDDNRLEFQAMQEIWNDLGELAGVEDELLPNTLTTNTPQKKRSKFWPVAIAASIALVAGALVWQMWPPVSVQGQNTLVSYSTPAGQQKNVELADGSRVTLNTNTRIVVDFNNGNRRVVLERGEALFDVTGDPLRPFVVDTGTRAVTVLGTRFNVYKFELSLQLSVIEGLVAIHRPEDQITEKASLIELSANDSNDRVLSGDQFLLKAGLEAYFSGPPGTFNAVVKARPVEGADHAPLWTEGFVRFKDQSLLQVVRELNRYSTRKILIEDDRIINIKISGLFKVDELDGVLNRFERLFDLQVTNYPDRIILVSKDASGKYF